MNIAIKKPRIRDKLSRYGAQQRARPLDGIAVAQNQGFAKDLRGIGAVRALIGHQLVDRHELADQIGALAPRSLNLDIVLGSPANQGAPQRRGERDTVLGAIDLFGHHDLEFRAQAAVEVLEFNLATESDGGPRDRIEIDHREFGDARLEIAEAGA